MQGKLSGAHREEVSRPLRADLSAALGASVCWSCLLPSDSAVGTYPVISLALVGVADFMVSWGYHEDHRCQAEAETGQGLGSQGAVMFLSTNQSPQTSHLHLTPNVSLLSMDVIGTLESLLARENKTTRLFHKPHELKNGAPPLPHL